MFVYIFGLFNLLVCVTTLFGHSGLFVLFFVGLVQFGCFVWVVCVCFWLVACLGCWDFGSLGCLLQFSSTACATRVFSTDKLRCSSRSGSGGLRSRRFHSGAAPRKVPAQCPSQVQEVSGAVPKVKQVLEDSGVVPRR